MPDTRLCAFVSILYNVSIDMYSIYTYKYMRYTC